MVETVISTVQVTVTSTATVDVTGALLPELLSLPYGKFLTNPYHFKTVSSTIVDVATPTDYYENWYRGQGGFYYDFEHYLGGYPNVGDSLSTATTDICLDYCSGGLQPRFCFTQLCLCLFNRHL